MVSLNSNNKVFGQLKKNAVKPVIFLEIFLYVSEKPSWFYYLSVS
jgi:hypothetical protein